MRKTSSLVALMAACVVPAQAADQFPPYYPPVEVHHEKPDSAFYLRGSAAVNWLWTHEHLWDCAPCSSNTPIEAGFGYSFGAGVGFETGEGLRVDVTADFVHNTGLTDGIDTLTLRAGLALANVYFDMSLSDWDEGGLGIYAGAGLGAALYTTEVPGIADGAGWTAAAALMGGASWDLGPIVADLGYRLVYMPTLTNGQEASSPFYLNDNFLHELRGTVRYRLD